VPPLELRQLKLLFAWMPLFGSAPDGALRIPVAAGRSLVGALTEAVVSCPGGRGVRRQHDDETMRKVVHGSGS